MRRLALILAALVLAFPVAGCGGGEDDDTAAENVETGATDTGDTTTEAEGTTTEEGEEEAGEGDPANGKTIFSAQGCGSCHVLSDAGSSGSVGPNLDDSKPDFELVVDRVTNGSGAMPSFSDKLDEQEIKDVAAYVSTSAGS
jgi:mono/diheme cytochrome c family protein